MSKFTEQLQDIGIHNQNGVAGHGNPYIAFARAERGRGWANRSAYFQVVRPGYKTDPAHWRDYGCKTFTVFSKEDKVKKFEEVKTWAGNRYKITEWALTPFGSWMDAGFVQRRVAELKAKLAAKAGNATPTE